MIGQSGRTRRRGTRYSDLIRREARMGGELFGSVPADGRREFFCLDAGTWIWHEEWLNASGTCQHQTTRYDVRAGAVMKVQDGQPSRPISPAEAANLAAAIQAYQQRVHRELYQVAV